MAKPQVRALFPTPVVTVQMEGVDQANAALKAAILRRERDDHEGVHASNLGGWQSSWDLEDWAGAPAKALLDQARALASHMTTDRAGQSVKIGWKTNAWANVNRSGQANEFHTHPGAFWSGTYYVDDGGIGDNPKLGGEFEMADPRGVAPAMYAPSITMRHPGALSMGASELIHPKTGLLVLFPSWLSHAVRPYHGNAMRISIAFNLSV